MSDSNRDYRTTAQGIEEKEELRRQLEEAQQTLEAIRHGDVDALVVAGPRGEQIYSLAGVEHIYRVIVETMNEAALTVDPNGTILFCNRRFCELMKTPIPGAMGRKLTAFVAGPQQTPLRKLLADAQIAPVQRRLMLRAADGTAVPVQLSASLLETGHSPSLCLVASDLTELEASAKSIRVLRENRQALEESEHRYRELVRCAPAGIFEIDFRRRRFLSINDAMCWICGYSQEELLALDPFDLLDDDSRARFQARIDQWLAGEEPDRNVEYRVRTKKGRILNVLLNTTFTTDEEGRPLGATVVAHDITARKRAEDALRDANETLRAQTEQLQTANDLLQAKQLELEDANEDLAMQERDLRDHAEALQTSQERLALAASGARIGMYEWNVATGETLWSDQVARLLGLRTTTTTVSLPYHYQDWAARVHPEDLPRVEAELRRCRAEQTPHEAEYRVVWPDGSVHWVADRGIFQYESDGPCARMLGILMDVTERKQAEEALRDSQALVHAVMDGSPDLIYVKDIDGRILMANPAACEALGRPAKEVIGKSAREFHREDLEVGRTIMENDRRIMESGKTETIEELGSKGRTYLSTKAPYRDADGNILGLLGISHDITERKRAEEALKESEFHLAQAQQMTHLGSWSWDIAAGRLYWSDETYRLYGLQPGESVPRHEDFLGFVHPEDRPRVEKGVQEARARGGSYHLDFRLVRRGGEERYVHCETQTICDAQGHPTKAEGALQDITERKRAEEALRELNATLESKVAQRTAELQHRANQLRKLTLELSQAEERERRRVAVVLHEDLQQQIAGAKFHLRLLNGRDQHESQHDVVQRIDEMLKEAIEKSRRLSHDLRPAVLHMNDLAEVLQWLAKQVGARHGLTVHVDAMGEAALQSESLTLFLFRAAQEVLLNVVKHAQVKEATIRVRRAGRHVCLCISDTGCGFDLRELKDTAGFGLLGIRERVELVGGRMKIRSLRDRGTAVRIVVPDAPENGKTAP